MNISFDKTQYIPQKDRKKILLLSDDIRFPSGVASVSKDIVTHTSHVFNWVQLGASVGDQNKGQVFDVSKDINKSLGIDDAYCKIYSINGYGNQNLLRELIMLEKPDVIMHFTDPRVWGWLYDMEHEIRLTTPLIYLNIWDSLPDPQYNQNAYMSCDLLMSISKQTYGINKRVLERAHRTPIDYKDINDESEFDHILGFLPHGPNHNTFYPIESKEDKEKMNDWLIEYFGEKNPIHDSQFVVFWNNRNMRRKQPGDLILSFKLFLEKVKEKYGDEVASKVMLLCHTTPIDDNGTDMLSVCNALLDDEDKVQFSSSMLSQEQINYLYNRADITVNITSNEGFGISTCESLASGTPILVNVTGGLQDQCGFKNEVGKYLTYEDYLSYDWGSNQDGKYSNHGVWVKTVYPTNLSLQGAPITPYIFDDRCSYLDVSEKMFEWFETKDEVRKQYGLEGRKFLQENLMTSEIQGKRFIDMIKCTLNYAKPIKQYELIDSDEMSDENILSTITKTIKYREQ